MNDGGKQQRRLLHDRPRDGGSLLLSAGQLVRPMVQPATEPHAPQRYFGAFPPLAQPDTAVLAPPGRTITVGRRSARPSPGGTRRAASLA
jgi:hypothetical protein